MSHLLSCILYIMFISKAIHKNDNYANFIANKQKFLKYFMWNLIYIYRQYQKLLKIVIIEWFFLKIPFLLNILRHIVIDSISISIICLLYLISIGFFTVFFWNDSFLSLTDRFSPILDNIPFSPTIYLYVISFTYLIES